ncbi:hypothetical protein JT359_05490 [Candidatus Poribacteria bacterium]|nr:hypothetical protein [Candidatus Poribacteria bacterium]
MHLQSDIRHDDVNLDTTKWKLPENAIARLGTGRIKQFAISPDKKYIAVATLIGTWVYERSTLIPIRLFDSERGFVTTLDFSPNSQWLVTGDADGTIKVWDHHHGICISRIELPQAISTIVFSGNGQHIASPVTTTDIIDIFHVETGELIYHLSTNPDTKEKWRGPPHSICYSDDGQLLACANTIDAEGTIDFISIWQVETSECIAYFYGHTDLVHALDFSPCGRLLASCDTSGTLREWEVDTGNQVQVFSEYSETHWIIPSYSTTGALRIAAVGKNETTDTIVLDLELCEKLKTFKQPMKPVNYNIQFAKGTTLAFSYAAQINVWDMDTPDSIDVISTDISLPRTVAFSPDGQKLIGVGSGPATYWTLDSKKFPTRLILRTVTQTPISTQTLINSVRISKQEDIVALSTARNMLYLWDIKTYQTIYPTDVHQKSLPLAAYYGEPGGELDSRLHVWDINGKQHTIHGHSKTEAYVLEAVLSSTGKKWASGHDDGMLYVWDREENCKKFSGHTTSICALAFSPNEKYMASASTDGIAKIWDILSGETLASLTATQLDVDVYKGDDLQKQILEKQQREMSKQGEPIPCHQIREIAFSPCGTLIAAGLHGEIRLWDAITYNIHTAILLPQGCQYPYAIAFSPWDGI